MPEGRRLTAVRALRHRPRFLSRRLTGLQSMASYHIHLRGLRAPSSNRSRPPKVPRAGATSLRKVIHRPHPQPPLRSACAFHPQERGGEGEGFLKGGAASLPHPSNKLLPSPRPSSQHYVVQTGGRGRGWGPGEKGRRPTQLTAGPRGNTSSGQIRDRNRLRQEKCA